MIVEILEDGSVKLPFTNKIIKNAITTEYEISDNKIIKCYRYYNTPMNNFNVDKYLGEWYLLASIPQPYEAGCYYQKAIYKYCKSDSKKVCLTNICYDQNWNEVRRIDGTINFVYKSAAVVNFDSKYALNKKVNYIVVDTDYENYAIVGSPDNTSAYLLIRNPNLNKRYQISYMILMKNLGFKNFRYRLGKD